MNGGRVEEWRHTLVDRSGSVGQQLHPNHFGRFLIALTESRKEDCKCYESFSECDLKRIEETASCTVSIHSSSLTIGPQVGVYSVAATCANTTMPCTPDNLALNFAEAFRSCSSGRATGGRRHAR